MQLYGSRLSNIKPRTEHTDTLFAPVTLTLTRWPWYTKLTWVFWRCTCIPKMKFMGPGFQRFQKHGQYRHADRRDWTYYHIAFMGGDGNDSISSASAAVKVCTVYYVIYWSCSAHVTSLCYYTFQQLTFGLCVFSSCWSDGRGCYGGCNDTLCKCHWLADIDWNWCYEQPCGIGRRPCWFSFAGFLFLLTSSLLYQLYQQSHYSSVFLLLCDLLFLFGLSFVSALLYLLYFLFVNLVIDNNKKNNSVEFRDYTIMCVSILQM